MQAPACANCIRRNDLCEYQSFNEPQTSQRSSEVLVLGISAPADMVISDMNGPVTSASYTPGTWVTPHAAPNSGTIESSLSSHSPTALETCLWRILRTSWFTTMEQGFWHAALKKSAFKYDYVQHGIFSLSALIDEFDPSRGYNPIEQKMPVAAYHHHITASALFRKYPLVVDKENWVAVLAFGITLVIFHFAAQQLVPDEDFNLFETIRILRGSNAINAEAAPFLTQSEFWPLILQRTLTPLVEMDDSFQYALQQLARVVTEAMGSGHENADSIRQAFWELREWTFECQGNPRTWRHYLCWPAAVSEEYLTLLSEGDDTALLIFIYWCAILHRSPKRWFITAWSKRAALQAVGMLKADWSDVLAWPIEIFTTVSSMVPDKLKQTALLQRMGTSDQMPFT